MLNFKFQEASLCGMLNFKFQEASLCGLLQGTFRKGLGKKESKL